MHLAHIVLHLRAPLAVLFCGSKTKGELRGEYLIAPSRPNVAPKHFERAWEIGPADCRRRVQVTHVQNVEQQRNEFSYARHARDSAPRR